ncbi:MAG: hypothetical protein RL508_506 [Actinomycetota bacterium]|jgi:outer membrane protein OmpA-like peptidoglycan-associated protein
MKLKKFLSAVAAALLPIAALSNFAAAPAHATVVPFNCDSTLYQATATNSGAMYSFDTTTQVFSRFGASNVSGLNAIGYNTKDNLIYGLASNKIIQIDGAGTYATPFGSSAVTVSTGTLGTSGGDFLPYGGSGDAYMLTAPSSGNSWSKLNVDTNTATDYTLTSSSATTWGAFDLTIMSNGTTAYGLDATGSGAASLDIVTLGATSGTITSKTVTLDASLTTAQKAWTSSGSFGAAYSDVAGDLFFFSNDTKYMYQITAASLATTSPVLTGFGAVSTLTSPNDGASCGLASSPLAPTVVSTTSGATPSGTNITLAGSVTPGSFTGAAIGAGNAKVCYSSANTQVNGLLSVGPVCSTGSGAIASGAGATAISYTFDISGLAAGTYYYQAQATNANATNQGAIYSFTVGSSAPATYNVTWDPNGGSVAPTSSANVTTVTTPTPTLAGNSFNGWNCSPAGSPANAVAANVTFTPSANTTCTASWTPYTVTYVAGTGSGTAPTSPNSGVVVLPSGSGLTPPSGQNFTGWSCTPGTPSGTLAVGASFTPTGNATCTAQYAAPSSTFTVTWDANGGTVSPTTSTQASSGASVTAPTPHLAGNSFDGWTCTPAGSPANPVAAAAAFVPSAATTCVANWTPYTVTYNFGTGGGTVPTSPNSGVVVLPGQGSMTAPTSGYTFGGWTCAPGTPSGTLATGASFTPTGNATCTAVWNAPAPSGYNITWNNNNGSGNTSSSGVTTVTTPNPSNPGYSFNGWSCSPAGTPANLVAAGVTFTPSANTTCTASWTLIPPVYNVTFVSNGSTVATSSGVAGTVITCPAAPTRAGWIFRGWSACAAGGSYTITGSATITAIWIEELAPQANGNGGENNHQAAPSTLVVAPAINGQVYNDPSSGLKLTLTPHEADQTPAPLTTENQVVFKDGRLAKVTGSGLQPNSDVKVYISKDAITGLQTLTVGSAAFRNKSVVIGDVVLLGTVKTDATGSFSQFLPIPADLAVGAHVLQVDGYAKDWSIQSANFPVLYAVAKVITKSLTVYFTPDSAEFTAATKATIAALVAQLPKDGEQFSISSKGFVYPIDNHTANMKISSARAKAVAGAIKAAITDLGQTATVDHVGLGRLKAAKSTSRRVQATVSWTVYVTA